MGKTQEITQIERSKRRCSLCGTRDRYVLSRKCVECARRYRQKLRTEKQRDRDGLPPLKGTLARLDLARARQVDAVKREFAEFNREKTYTSDLPCKNGHASVVRYVSSGGCVACQKQGAAARYARKPRGVSLY